MDTSTTINYLRIMAQQNKNKKFNLLATRIEQCGTQKRKYKTANEIKTITYHCQSIYCPICQQNDYQEKYDMYTPILQKYSKTHYLTRIIFSTKKISFLELYENINKIYNSFEKIIRYLKGDKKIRNLDFIQYGYLGAIKILKLKTHSNNLITPTLDCIFIFNKQSSLKNLPIKDLIQKIWTLLTNDIEITKKEILNTSIFSSQTQEQINYTDFFSQEDIKQINYKNFKLLYETLNNRNKFITYGILKKSPSLNSEEKQLLDNFRSLPRQEKAQALEYINHLAKQRGNKQKQIHLYYE